MALRRERLTMTNAHCPPTNSPKARDVFIDVLRGICVLSMIFTHAGEGTSLIRMSLGRTVGFFSGAEGFFFLSGLVFGRVYVRRCRERGEAATGKAVWQRVLKLYQFHLASVVCLVVAAQLFPAALLELSPRFATEVAQPLKALVTSALLIHQPKYFDVLPLYMLYLPIAWALIKRGYDRSPWLPTVSLVLWAAQQVSATSFGTRLSPGAFNVLAYQAVFFCGLWAAHGLPRAIVTQRGRISWMLAVGLVASVACVLLSHPKSLGLHGERLDTMVTFTMAQAEKFSMGWLRVVSFFAIAASVYCLRPWLERLPITALASLGKRSLEVFVGHIGVIVLLCWPVVALRARSDKGYSLAVLAVVAAVAVVLVWRDRRRDAARGLPAERTDTLATSAEQR
jgi:hypothetical protein